MAWLCKPLRSVWSMLIAGMFVADKTDIGQASMVTATEGLVSV